MGRQVNCNGCRRDLTGVARLDGQEEHCPGCWSTNFNVSGSFRIEVRAELHLAVRAKHPSPTYRGGSLRKPALERQSGDSLTVSDGVWRRFERVFDREHDVYEETIWNPDGSEYLRKRERLSEHRDSGSAKPPNH